MKKAKHHKKDSKLQSFSKALFLMGIFLFIYSGFNISKWFIDSNKTKNITKKIAESVVLPDKTNTDEINIDFSNLKKTNSDTVGWIEVIGTEVNYPFVQSTNNDFYLNHSFDKKYNSAGWIFLDCKNNVNNFDKNTILYAHGRLDNTMFGSLKYVLEKDWYNNPDNRKIKTFSENQNCTWEIFSVYHIPVTDDYLKISFNSDSEFLDFINLIENRSVYNFNVNITESDNILTLSTCYNNKSDQRLVIHAKQIR